MFLKMSQEEAAGIMGEDDIQIENEIQTVGPPGNVALSQLVWAPG